MCSISLQILCWTWMRVNRDLCARMNASWLPNARLFQLLNLVQALNCLLGWSAYVIYIIMLLLSETRVNVHHSQPLWFLDHFSLMKGYRCFFLMGK